MLSRFWLTLGATVVLLVYMLPFLINRFRQGPFLIVAVEDEEIYLGRVMDAYRGGSLGNPYLAEHQDAPRFMPELAERLLALTAHLTGLDPLLVVAASRVVFPALIYALLWTLARGLGMEPRLAMLAAMLSPLAPTISWLASADSGKGFFRYFRTISPAFYVVLLLLVMRLVQIAWRKAFWWIGLLAGAGLGLLFYATPVYYWSSAIGGVICLALFTMGRVRVTMLTSILVALIIGFPFFANVLRQEQMPDVQATLARLDLLIPGRSPDIYATRSFVLAVLVLAPVLLWRRRLGESGRFLIPFMCVGTLFMVQNVVTNRHLQGYHWIECLIPVWSLAAVAFLQNSIQSFRSVYFNALISVLAAGAIFLQANGYVRWAESQKEDVEFWSLDALMPRTLNWLNQHTPVNSVVIADPDIMDSLVLFTHNKVYWADYASQHVIPEWEVEARTRSLESWRPDGAGHLPFRADFHLGTGPACLNLNAKELLYRDITEGTCVAPVSSSR